MWLREIERTLALGILVLAAASAAIVLAVAAILWYGLLTGAVM